jgi:CRISPR-associated protein Cas2
MMILVSYDVASTGPGGKRRLRRVARACQDYGLRVQYSVFECDIDPVKWTILKARLLKEIDPKTDSLRFYFMGSNWKPHVEHIGAKEVIDLDGPIIL